MASKSAAGAQATAASVASVGSTHKAPKPRAARGAPSVLEGFVLHSYEWSESSLILDVFTRERGRLAVAAKGARRPHSQFRSVLLPFQRLHLSLGRHDGKEQDEVHTLRQAEYAGGWPMLAGEALFTGFYCNELLMKLLARQDAHPTLFEVYAATLPGLAATGEAGTQRQQAALRAFELFLLRETGHLPELGTVTLTLQPVQAASRYRLLPEAGVIAAEMDNEPVFSGAQLQALQSALDLGPYPGALGALQTACLGALGALRAALRDLLVYHAGTTSWRTRQVMHDVRQLLQT